MQRLWRPDVWGPPKSRCRIRYRRHSLEVGWCQAHLWDKQAETIKAARHQNLLLPRIAQVDEIKEDAEIREDMEIKEVLETLAATRGDRILR